MHDEAMAWIAKHATAGPVRVLDIGGRNVNGSPRGLFPGAAVYTVLDALPGEQVGDVDIIADAAEWHPDGRTWDVVVCAEVLEHAARWRAILRTAYRALAPGGCLIVTTAAPGRPPHSAVDGEFRLLPGEHYANIRPAELGRVLGEAGFCDVTVDVRESPADVRAVAVRPAEEASRVSGQEPEAGWRVIDPDGNVVASGPVTELEMAAQMGEEEPHVGLPRDRRGRGVLRRVVAHRQGA